MQDGAVWRGQPVHLAANVARGEQVGFSWAGKPKGFVLSSLIIEGERSALLGISSGAWPDVGYAGEEVRIAD